MNRELVWFSVSRGAMAESHAPQFRQEQGTGGDAAPAQTNANPAPRQQGAGNSADQEFGQD